MQSEESNAELPVLKLTKANLAMQILRSIFQLVVGKKSELTGIVAERLWYSQLIKMISHHDCS